MKYKRSIGVLRAEVICVKFGDKWDGGGYLIEKEEKDKQTPPRFGGVCLLFRYRVIFRYEIYIFIASAAEIYQY